MIIIAIRNSKVSFMCDQQELLKLKDGCLQVSLMRVSYRELLIDLKDGGKIFLL